MAHTHDVHDTGKRFEINGISRFIKETSETKLVLVQGDHKSEVVTFEMPRFIDGHDMLLCNKIRVHYINIDTKTSDSSADIYEVTDLKLCEDCGEEETLLFTWTIEAPATKYFGSLSFLVKFECTEGDNILYQWNTARYVNVNVLNGIDNSEAFVDKYSNVLEEWYNELTKGADSIEELNQQALAEIEHAKEDAKEDIQGKADATMAEMNQFSSNAYNSFKNDVDEKAAETLASIPEDYSDLDADVKMIYEQLKNIATFVPDKNIFKNDISLSGYYDRFNNGVHASSNGFKCTPEYTSIDESADILYFILTETVAALNVLFYDENNNHLKAASFSNVLETTVTIPAGAKKFMIYVPASYGGEICISYEKLNAFEEYKEIAYIIAQYQNGSITKEKLAQELQVALEKIVKNENDIKVIDQNTSDLIIPITNLVNGKFENLDGWVKYGTGYSISVENNKLKIEFDTGVKSTNVRFTNVNYNVVAGNKVFASAKLEFADIKWSYAEILYYSSGNISEPFYRTAQIYPENVVDGMYQISEMITIPDTVAEGTLYFQVKVAYSTDETSIGSLVYISNFMLLDITDSYGDYIPTTKEVENVIKNAGYIDGTSNRFFPKTLTDKKEYPQRFIGKSCVIFGDSIMDSYDVDKFLSDLSGMTIYNCAVGGTRASKHVYDDYDAFSFYKLAESIALGDYSTQEAQATSIGKNAPKRAETLKNIDWTTIDYVLVAYGTNDFTANATAGTVEDNSDYKYALNYGIEKLLSVYPHLKFMLVTPMFRADLGTLETGFIDGYTNSQNLKLLDFVEAMKEVGKATHIPVCDNYYGLQINKYNYAHYLNSTNNDFVHPNKETGSPLIASRIYGQLYSNL